MQLKLFEIRDRGTLIPAVGLSTDPLNAEGGREDWLLKRAGYGDGSDLVILVRLHPEAGRVNATYNPEDWKVDNTRTMHVAHWYIQEHWKELITGQVICVEHILGEREKPKETEQR